MTTIYFHGAPGSPAELSLFDQGAAGFLAPDRFLDRSRLPFPAYLDVLSQKLDAAAGAAQLRLIGFSLGARIALEVARRLPGRVSRVELISPAGPLELGDFLPRMKGRAVFGLARSAPRLLPLLTWVQARLAHHQPRRMLELMFGEAAGADAALAADPRFAAAVTRMLRESFGAGARGYHREVLAYVRPWSALLADSRSPVRLWQGAADDWTPPDMAQSLQAALPNADPVRLLDGLSHYSTLRLALAEIAAGR